MLHWLVSLGGIGLFLVAVIDYSVIPLPLPGSTDLLLLLLTAHRGTSLWMVVVLTASALAGSMVGGYLTWKAGSKGGEAMLEKRVPARFLRRINGWVERNGALSVGLAAFLPPPIPLTPFLLAAGALKVPLARFFLGYGLGRMARYGLLAWLGFTYGRHVVRLWEKTLAGWTAPILWTYGGLVAAGIAYGIWKYMRSRRTGAGSSRPAEDLA